MTQQLTTKSLFSQSSVQERFEKLLGNKAQGFISSVLQTVANNSLLEKADPTTVLNAAATAASLDLPINQNLGFAWIVPYKGQAQFQIGWKGYVQLAQRSGQYKKINVVEVYQNQFTSFNALTEELIADFSKDGEGNIVGYAAYFQLVNGMEKLCYWSKEAVIKHAKKYSKAYNTKYSPWSDVDQFDAMAKKTVLKNTISKWGIMSINMQAAQLTDQAVLEAEGRPMYVDNVVDQDELNTQTETARIKEFVGKATSVEDLENLEDSAPDMSEEARKAIEEKKSKLKAQ